MKYLSIAVFIPLILLFSGSAYTQGEYFFTYQMVYPQHPELKIYEYHEWSSDIHLSMVIDSSEVEEVKVTEYDDRGFPVSKMRTSSPSALSTIMPLYKNKKEGYIIRTVTNPWEFFTNPQMIQILEDYLEFEWKISGEQKLIDDLQCIKATTEFRCRDFTAWFAPEISVPSGPFFFHGLPGLIVRLEFEQSELYFELREFGSLDQPELNLEILGIDPDNRWDLATHCDLQEEFDRYVQILHARAGDPDCKNCPTKIKNVRWDECWDECD
nr:GLPGLI family protein [Saprospiraceae bacterium]